MAVTHGKKGLGRGLAALIPDADMEFLSRVARGDAPSAPIRPSSITPKAAPAKTQAPTKAPARAKAQGLTTPKSKSKAPRQQPVLDEQALIEPEKVEIIEKANLPLDIEAQETQNENQLPHEVVTVESATARDKAEEGSFEIESSLTHATQWLVIGAIQANPYQPRRTFSEQEMQDLVTSIREHGILQPILVRPLQTPGGQASTPHYQLVAGERRWRAAQLAGLSQIPAIVRPVSDQQALELALIENVQRHDITPLDAALAYRRLADEFSLSQDAVAQRVGKSRVAVANTLRLLDLPVEAQKAIEDGVLSEGHGRAILLANGDGARRAVFRRVLREKLSVRATEDLARQTLSSDDEEATDSTKQNSGSRASSAKRSKKDDKSSVEVRALEDKLQRVFQTRVRLKTRAKGGQVIIEFFSPDDLERIIRLINTPE